MHHQLGVGVDLVDEFSQHWHELVDCAVGAKQLSDLLEALDRVEFSVGVLTREVVDEKGDCADLIDVVLVHLLIFCH